ncbi:MAG: pyrrolo-quinoline quinone [Acidobacteriaceae bacterium]|nr:pyrrolo-quinoline quinone [Acidobacteriaceae bacterium]
MRTHRFLVVLLFLSLSHSRAQVNVLTWHNTNKRDGRNTTETILTPANVNMSTFGLLFTIPVDGKVDAQPLYVQGLTVAGAKHNVLFVATENDSVYAFDADAGALLWHRSVFGVGETPSDNRSCDQVEPTIGVTATPVINQSFGPHGTIYVEAMSKNSSGQYFHRLHALDLTTGTEEFGGPVTIAPTYKGTGDGSSGGEVRFDPGQYKERAALLNLKGLIYLGFSSHCDIRPYTGWLVGFDAYTLMQTNVINVTPNGSGGAIWMSGAGPAATGTDIYILTANGTFDAKLNASGFPTSGDYGNAFVKLETASGEWGITDYFTMSNTTTESSDDTDFGSGGVLLMGNVYDANKNVRELAVGAGKDTNLYVVDRTNLGKYSPNGNDIFQVLPDAFAKGIFSSPAWLAPYLFYGPSDAPIQAFQFSGGKFAAAPSSKTSESFGYPGATPSISCNGQENAILWAVGNHSTAVLYAYDALDLSNELYNSNLAANDRDHFGAGNKFITPTIANGKVYVGTTTGVGVFGLLK